MVGREPDRHVDVGNVQYTRMVPDMEDLPPEHVMPDDRNAPWMGPLTE